jgi:threonine aldolase
VSQATIDVDLYSDTMTRPTTEMRRFMCDAEVGDEQKHEDPTVNLLQEMVADLLGKEAALFLPSGTMCNEIAMRVHCRPGDEMLAHRTAHPIHFESGGPGALAGVNVRALDVAEQQDPRRTEQPGGRGYRAVGQAGSGVGGRLLLAS